MRLLLRACPYRAQFDFFRLGSVRMARENVDLLNELTKEQRSDFSEAAEDMVSRGRILLAAERYKQEKASLGRPAELGRHPHGQMMTI